LGKKWVWLGVIFSVFGSLAAFGIGNMVQANAVAEGLKQFGLPTWVAGGILIISVALVTLGGIKRIAHVAMVFVPFMCAIYIIGTLIIIFTHIKFLPFALKQIITYAFTPLSAIGGFAGAQVRLAIKYGIARGVFSNEAGLGSAPIAHATAITKHPVAQGFWGVVEVFIDTIVMCTLTALAIMVTGVWQTGETGATLTIKAFSTVFGGKIGSSIVLISMILTAYDTNLAWCFYGESCLSYLVKGRWKSRYIYRLIWLPFTMIGALGGLEMIWEISDTLNGLMAIPNLIGIIALSRIILKLKLEFFNSNRNSKKGKYSVNYM
jgi:AGCS family alanine or glycine:cation symporter